MRLFIDYLIGGRTLPAPNVAHQRRGKVAHTLRMQGA